MSCWVLHETHRAAFWRGRLVCRTTWLKSILPGTCHFRAIQRCQEQMELLICHQPVQRMGCSGLGDLVNHEWLWPKQGLSVSPSLMDCGYFSIHLGSLALLLHLLPWLGSLINIMLWNGFSSNIYTIRESTDPSTSHSLNAFLSKVGIRYSQFVLELLSKSHMFTWESIALPQAQESVHSLKTRLPAFLVRRNLS